MPRNASKYKMVDDPSPIRSGHSPTTSRQHTAASRANADDTHRLNLIPDTKNADMPATANGQKKMAATRDTMDRAITFNMVVARFIFSAQR
jgi:hypothetical protein